MIETLIFIFIFVAIIGGAIYYIYTREKLISSRRKKQQKEHSLFKKNIFHHLENTLKEIDYLNMKHKHLGDKNDSKCYDKNKKLIKDCKCHPSCKTCGYSDNPVGMNQCIKCNNNTSVNELYSNGTGWCGSFGPSGILDSEKNEIDTLNSQSSNTANNPPSTNSSYNSSDPLENLTKKIFDLFNVPYNGTLSTKEMMKIMKTGNTKYSDAQIITGVKIMNSLEYKNKNHRYSFDDVKDVFRKSNEDEEEEFNTIKRNIMNTTKQKINNMNDLIWDDDDIDKLAKNIFDIYNISYNENMTSEKLKEFFEFLEKEKQNNPEEIKLPVEVAVNFILNLFDLNKDGEINLEELRYILIIGKYDMATNKINDDYKETKTIIERTLVKKEGFENANNDAEICAKEYKKMCDKIADTNDWKHCINKNKNTLILTNPKCHSISYDNLNDPRYWK